MSIKRIAIYLFLLNSTISFNQKGYEIGGGIGLSNYFGDLNTRLSLQNVGLAASLHARYNFNTRTAVKSSLSLARIRANDDNSSNQFERIRNLRFRSNIIDFTAMAEFNFYDYIHGSPADNWTPYMALGFSAFHFNPKADLNGTTYNLRDLGTEGQEIGDEYLLFNGGITLGGGMKWDITRDISMNAEITLRKIFTDYIDDVSSTYPDFATLVTRRQPNGEIARQLSNPSPDPDFFRTGKQRGNSKDNDTYAFFSISIMKYFGSIPCPKLTR
jgi:hypothetical protein